MIVLCFCFNFVLLDVRKPAVVMIVGVNGGGKTTSLGKKYGSIYLHQKFMLQKISDRKQTDISQFQY